MLWFLISCGGGLVELESRHLADVEVQLTPDRFELKAGLNRLLVDLRALRVDSLGRPIEGTEITQLQLFVFPGLSLDEVAEGLADDSLIQSDVGVFLEAAIDVALPLEDEYEFEVGQGTWLLIAADAAGEAQRMAFLLPTEGGAGELVWEAEAAQIAVDLGWGDPLPWGASYDWSGVETDVQGRELLHRQLDLLSVAQVELDADELAERFIELEELAVQRVDVDLNGQVRLDALEIPGFEPGPGWVMGLSCQSCSSPVPRVLARMEQ